MVIVHGGGGDDAAVLGDQLVQAHPQEAVGLGAEGLPVEEVAPAAQALADQKAQGGDVQHRANLHLLDPGKDQNADGSADDAAVNGQATVPDIQNFDGVVLIAVPLEDAVVQPGAQNGKGHDAQHAVGQIVHGQAELAAAAAGVKDRQQQAHGDDEAVQMDAQGADVQGAGWIDLDAQTGERNGRQELEGHNVSSFKV